MEVAFNKLFNTIRLRQSVKSIELESWHTSVHNPCPIEVYPFWSFRCIQDK